MTRPLDIGPILIASRLGQRVSQTELARRLGVSQPQIARWEASEYRSASLANVDAAARALGLELGEPHSVAAEAPAVYSPESAALGLFARLGVRPDAIAAFCRSHGIRELSVFGSAARGDFGPGSDIDLLVVWQDDRRPAAFGELEDLQTELAGIFRREVDLLDRESVERSENYVRRLEILAGARTIYGQG